MIVWRIEDKDGKGPWHSNRIDMVRVYTDSLVNSHGQKDAFSPDRMPVSWNDRRVDGFDHYDFKLHAYPSLGVLFKWWRFAKDVGDTAGLKVTAYRLQGEYDHRENQVMYRKEEAVPIKSLDFQEAHTLLMHGSPELVYASG